MKLTCDLKALHATIAHVAQVIPSHPAVPLLAGMVLDVDDFGLTASAFDYERSASAQLETNGATDGRVLVSGRMLLDMLGRLPSGLVDLVADDRTLTITSGRARCTLPLLPVAEYPNLPDLPEVVGALDAVAWSDALKFTALAAGADDTLAVLRSVRLEAVGGTLAFAATDRYRLHVVELPWPGEEFAALLPEHSVKAACLTLGGTVRVHADEFTVAVSSPDRTTSTRLTAGEYVRWRSLLPDNPHTLTVDAGALADSLRRTALVVAKNGAARLSISKDAVRIEAGEDDRVVDEIDAAFDGPPLEIAFNPEYLAAALEVVVSGTAHITFATPSRPVTVVDPERTGYLAMVMPVRLNK